MRKKKILKDFINQWNLISLIDETVLKVKGVIQEITRGIAGAVAGGFKVVEDDFQRYIHDVKNNVEVLLKVI
jgi:hypothetical protein